VYKAVDPKLSFPKMEEGILEFWQKQNIFEKSIRQREGREEYVFYDGPPFATGLPHFGHFVPGTIKDIIPRYKAMQGLKVERRFGWDCHGLPVEYEMEKELGISGKRQIEEYGIARFNEDCRSIVLRYTSEWRSVITRLGRWVDFDNDYKTMEPDYMESIWWIMQELWNRELLYEGFYILPYCPRCSTALSNFELNLGGYQNVQDPSITVKFKRLDEPDSYFLAWTTTPWTLPSNLALALGPEIEYAKVADGSDQYILAEERLPTYYKSPGEYRVLKRYRGKQLAGIEYEPLFPYFASLREKGAFRTYVADYVSTEEGTGIVHTAPGFGEDDYSLLKDTEVPTICPVDAEARFTEEVTDYQGLFVKEADKRIIKDLKARGAVVHHSTYLHAYPHCWRCSSPLIYRAISSWFVNIQKIKSSMLEANSRVFWVPGHIRDGRFGKWLEGARDWAISRNRYWGNPLPIWKCEDCGHQKCIGSRAELEKLSKQKVTDLHKHFVDEITFPCTEGCGGTMRRIPEVLDCWFESGAMPYGQNHYPFENREHFEANFPADFISEGLDQTRGWFYTLTVLAAALFDKPAFTHCIVNGLVLAEDGKKMSKSARNYTDPMEVMNEFGADALRLFLMDSACVKAEDLRYSDSGVKEVLKNVIIPLWNSYSFFVTYANIDRVRPDRAPENPENPMDRWILSETQALVRQVTEQMELYDLQKGIDPIIEFIDSLNNWYIRRSRRRFWRPEKKIDVDKRQAYQTLYSVLITLMQVAAPFIPFITEEIYRNLKAKELPESVHLTDFPTYDPSRRNPELEEKMGLTRRAVSMGRALRTLHSLKIRQPLKALHLVTKDQREKRILIEMEELIKDELNVRSVVFRENEEELVEYTAKPNYKILGKQLGKDMKAAAARIEGLSMREIQSLLEGATLSIEVGDRVFDLTEEGVIIARTERENLKVLNEGSLTVALDSELTEELIQEGMARDLVRGIQNLRKELDLEVTDRIELALFGTEQVKRAVELNEDTLKSETLAVSWKWKKQEGAAEIDCGQETCFVSVKKAADPG